MPKFKDGDSEDLVGFEEYLESIGEPVQNNPIKNDGKGNAPTPRPSNPNENLSFLINDSERLKKLSNLLCNRLPQYEKYPQADQLIQAENHTLNIIKSDVIEILKKDGSIFHQSMAQLINTMFKS
jgi:hypothetical protein